jgi:hypothetical protein
MSPQFDIFSGRRDGNEIWLGAVEGLGATIARMKEYAKELPGPYFVFCASTHEILASIDTSVPKEMQKRQSA